jgi:hypothetical protein
MNLQTSFLTPPFGFALFYLRSVAPKADYKDRITGEQIPAVTTTQIYKGSIAFIVLQLIMVAAVIAWPGLVMDGIEKTEKIDADKALQEMTMPSSEEPRIDTLKPDSGLTPASGDKANDDATRALEDAIKKDAQKAK